MILTSLAWISPRGEIIDLIESDHTHFSWARQYFKSIEQKTLLDNPVENLLSSGWIRVVNPINYEGPPLKKLTNRQCISIAKIISDHSKTAGLDIELEKIVGYDSGEVFIQMSIADALTRLVGPVNTDKLLFEKEA